MELVPAGGTDSAIQRRVLASGKARWLNNEPTAGELNQTMRRRGVVVARLPG
jgi:hypothetical protein